MRGTTRAVHRNASASGPEVVPQTSSCSALSSPPPPPIRPTVGGWVVREPVQSGRTVARVFALLMSLCLKCCPWVPWHRHNTAIQLGVLETWSGAPGPHAHGNVARRVVDDRRAEVCGRRKPPYAPQQPAQPPVRRLLGPADTQTAPAATSTAPAHQRHQQEHRPQRPTERSDPTQHAKGRTGDCPGPRKETTTRRNVTRGGG